MIQGMGPVERRDTPYFGLDYYEEKFGAWFFGREAETSKVITNLRAARLTLLHADSGVGKSSLLRAGVAWRMQRLAADCLARHGTARSVPIVFASWKDNPVLELVGAIRMGIGPYLGGRPLREPESDRLEAAIVAASDAVNAGLLIMLDQFEEYFLYRARESPSGRFVDELTRCVNRTDLRANFLISTREEAYAGLGDLFKGRMANVYGNYLHIECLGRAAAEKAIREPLDVYNGQPGVEQVTIRDELVAAVLDQVRAIDRDVPLGDEATRGGDGRIATPLLQLVMQTLWEKERAAGSRELRLSTLQDLRGVGMIVEAHLGKALSALDRGGRQAAVDVFGHLVTLSGGKIAESVPDLARVTGHSESQVGGVLDRLDHQRIVRPVLAAPGRDPLRYRRYEIFHDVLTPAISRMIAVHEEQRRTRRQRGYTAFVTALLIAVLAIAAGFALLWHKATAEQAAQTAAQSRQFAAEAEEALTTNPRLGAQLALQALHWRVTPQAEDALRTAVPEVQEVRMFQAGWTIPAMFDPADADKVLGADYLGLPSIWDVKTRHRLVRFSASGPRSAGNASSAVFNPVGTEVAVGYDNAVVFFGARSGKELRSISVKNVNALQFAGRRGELAIATQSGVEVCLPPYMLKNCHMLSREPAYAIAVDPDNLRELAVLGANGSEAIWTISDSDRLQRRLGLPEQVLSADFSPDGSEIATADDGGMVRVYRLATLKLVMTFAAGEPSADSVSFSPDGKQIVAGYSNGRVHVWDISTRLQLTALAGSAARIEAVSFSPEGSEVVTVSDDGKIRIWDAWPCELRTVFATSFTGGAPDPVVGASYMGDGSRVLALDASGLGYVLTAGGKRRAVINPGAQVVSIVSNQVGTKIVTDDMSGAVDVWQAVGAHFTRVHLHVDIRFGQAGCGLGISGDGSRIAIVSPDCSEMQVRSAQTGQLLQTLSSDQAIAGMAFSPTGRQILTRDDNGQVEAWDLSGGHQVLDRPGIPTTDAEYDSSGRQFVIVTEGGAVTLWNARNDQQIRQFSACLAPSSASLSPDDSKIVVACGDKSVGVYDAYTGQLLTRLPAASGLVETPSFGPDGKSIMTAIDGVHSAGGVQIWSTELADLSLPAVERMAGHLINP